MSGGVVLTDCERVELRVLARKSRDVKVALKARVILALDRGHSVVLVAELFLVDADTVASWRKRFEARGSLTDWMGDNYRPYQGKLSQEQLGLVGDFVAGGVVGDCGDVVDEPPRVL